MKRTDNQLARNHLTSTGRRFTSGILSLTIMVCGVTPALSLTDNPYNSIIGRNAFALKPPGPAPAAVAAPVVAASTIELQGFSTILGRPQVLLKIKIPPRPPDPAKDHSVVLDLGQREGDVEVVSMDVFAGVVQLKNRGENLSLNLKDNAAKPTAGPMISSPSAPIGMPGNQSGIPQMPSPPAINSSVPSVGRPTSTVPNSVPAVPPVPTRPLRGGSAGNQSSGLSAIESVAIMEIERERTKDLVKQGKFPPFPPPLPGVGTDK